MVTEYVLLSGESSQWVPGKWAVIQATLTGAGSGFVWVKRVSHGVATEQDLTDYIASIRGSGNVRPDLTKLVGSLGEYQVVAIGDVSAYRRNQLRTEDMPPSNYPVG